MANLQGVPLAFRKPHPWDEPVETGSLIDLLCSAINRFVSLQNSAALAVALWILHAHTIDGLQVSPILAIASPEKRCGKSTLLRVVGRLVPRPLQAGSITPAALFRTIAKYRPTLLIDEGDTFLGRSDELRGILNNGHSREDAVVVRTVGEHHDPRRFATFGPKAIALIGRLPATIEDRSILVSMSRRRRSERGERLRSDRDQEFETLRRMCERWAMDNLDSLRNSDPAVPDELDDRAADNWRYLLGIADLAKGRWCASARTAALVLSGSRREAETSLGIQLLADIRDVLVSGVDRIWSDDLVKALSQREDRPWPDYGVAGISKRQVARMLAPYGITPRSVRIGERVRKGYHHDQFEHAFSCYLDSEVEHPEQSDGTNPNQCLEKRNLGESVALTELSIGSGGTRTVPLVPVPPAAEPVRRLQLATRHRPIAATTRCPLDPAFLELLDYGWEPIANVGEGHNCV